jgi:hypothetical protein
LRSGHDEECNVPVSNKPLQRTNEPVTRPVTGTSAGSLAGEAPVLPTPREQPMTTTATDEPIIRTARAEDHAQACRLMDALDEVHRDRLPWMFQKPASQPRSESFFADLVNGEDSAVFVAEAGHLVGIALGLIRSAPELPVFVRQRWGVLDNLVVDPA